MLLIRNGTIVTALDRWVGDVACQDGRIVALGTDLEVPPGAESIDASGQYVFPGGVDPHVHMELAVMGTRSSDDFESGTAAGIAGGTTTIIDFVHPERNENLLDALETRRAEAAKAVADYGLHMAVTWWGDDTAAQMARCVNEAGITSFKSYMAYLDTVGIDDADLVRVMQSVADLDALLLVHAEHGPMVEFLRDRLVAQGKTEPKYHPVSRPPATEAEATSRAATLAGLLDARLYIVHVTCAEAMRAVGEARLRGQRVYAETCPQYLLLDDSAYDRPDFEGAAFVLSPPIRSSENQEALWGALRNGVLQVVATDHCPFHMHPQKEAGRHDFRAIPNGAAGIEYRLPLLYTHGVGAGRLDLHQFVDLTSTRPAKIFGLYPRKGSLTVGADADLVLWDPEATGTLSATTHHQRCDRSLFEGTELVGLPSVVVVAGRVQYRDGDLKVERGAGRYLERTIGRA